MKKLFAILLTLAFAVALIWFVREYERTGNMKAVGDEWARLSTTTIDDDGNVTYRPNLRDEGFSCWQGGARVWCDSLTAVVRANPGEEYACYDGAILVPCDRVLLSQPLDEM